MIKKALSKYTTLPIQVRASFWFLMCSFMQRGISVITTPIFTRLLSTEEYGQYSVFNSWLGVLTVFVTLDLYYGVFSSGMVRFEDHKLQFASAMQGLCTTLVVAWTVIYLVAHDFWNGLFGLTTVQMLAMLVMMWASAVFQFWSVEQRVDYRYRNLLIVTIITTIAKPVVGIIFVVLAEDKVTARILGLALVELAAYSWMFVSHMKRGKVFFSKEIWKYALAFNLPLLPHYLSTQVLSSADRIMISNLVGDSEAGIYSLAYSLSTIMTMFSTAMMHTIEPWQYRKIKDKRIQDLSRVAYPAFVLIAAVNILLIAFAPEIVAIFAPASYYDAIWVIPCVSMSMYFLFAYNFFSAIEFYYQKTKLIACATVSGAVLNIVLNYLLIPVFGYVAAGYTTLFCYMVYATVHYLGMRYVCHKYLDGTPYDLRILLSITAVFLAVGFLFLFTYDHMVIRYALILAMLAAAVGMRKKIMAAIKGFLEMKKG